MLILAEHTVDRLTEIEAGVHYSELPPPERMPFVVIKRVSPIVLSAPHGAIKYRNNNDEVWHEEDEYTAGIALLLSELCGTSVIATIWRTEDSDPNEHGEERSAYKKELRRLVASTHARWFIDLHAAKENSDFLATEQKIDLGAGRNQGYLPDGVYGILNTIIENHLGKGITDRSGMRGFDAQGENRMAAFAHQTLGIHSVKIEMKPSVRVPLRRIDSSMYQKNQSKIGGPYAANRQDVIGMMQALVEFIEYLKSYKE